eukprot:4138341-Amphidinium_carterae.2
MNSLWGAGACFREPSELQKRVIKLPTPRPEAVNALLWGEADYAGGTGKSNVASPPYMKGLECG